MGQSTNKKMSLLFVSTLILQTACASNLRWMAAQNGCVPPFAVVGGENFSGEPLYVARVKLPYGWTPGKMSPSYKVAHTSWGGLEYYKSNYEVLTNPGWVSHLEWKEGDGNSKPPNAVVGGRDGVMTVHVGRFRYGDGHMICGKVVYDYKNAYIGYDTKEFESGKFFVLVEHPRWYPALPGVTRVAITKQQDSGNGTNFMTGALSLSFRGKNSTGTGRLLKH